MITAQLMDRVFGGEGSTPKDAKAFDELALLAVPDDTVISDEAWLAIPNDARLKIMSMFVVGVSTIALGQENVQATQQALQIF